MPDEEQWWITGFNPKYKNPDPDVMVSVVTIDLSEHIDFYNAISDPDNAIYVNKKFNKEHVIFDDASKTVWIQWYT